MLVPGIGHFVGAGLGFLWSSKVGIEIAGALHGAIKDLIRNAVDRKRVARIFDKDVDYSIRACESYYSLSGQYTIGDLVASAENRYN
jgi:hypothetical protein